MQDYLFQYVWHSTFVRTQGTVDPGEPVIVETYVCVKRHVERAGGVTPGFGEPPQSGHGQIMDHAGGVQDSVCCLMSSDRLASTRLGKPEPKGAKHKGDEAPGMVPILRFQSWAILLSSAVSSTSVSGVTLR